MIGSLARLALAILISTLAWGSLLSWVIYVGYRNAVIGDFS